MLRRCKVIELSLFRRWGVWVRLGSQLKRYLLVGGSAYLIEMACLYSLHHVLGLSSIASVAISFWVGLVAAFILQKWVTFQNYDKRARVLASQILTYGLLVVWNYAFTLLAVKLFSSISVIIVRTVVILIITSWNFIIYKSLFGNSIEKGVKKI
jgi:putative flippase GtrA